MQGCIAEDIWIGMLATFIGDSPAGFDVRDDISPASMYQQIREARTLARNNERASIAAGETHYFSLPEWRIILDKAPQILISQSKDIEVVAWYIEALVREFGFRGAAAGFGLAAELIRQYGPSLFPRLDEDGVGSQLSALSGLNGFGADGALIGPIKSIALTQGQFPGPLAAWKCDQTFEIARINDEDRRNARLRQGGVSKEELERIVAETETVFLQEKLAAIDASINSFTDYQQVLDEYAQDDIQPTGNVKKALESCRQTLIYMGGERLRPMIESVSEELDMTGNDLGNSGENSPEASFSGHIKNREQALKQLNEIARFFRNTEPHSPISYSVEQVIRWSNLPLTELIKELIPDDVARTKFQHLSGMLQDGP